MRVPFRLRPAAAVDVVALGENSLDVVAVVGSVDRVAGKQALAAFRLEPGGQMATAALGCARLGFRTRYVGAFGHDEWSRRARQPLDDAGVEVVAIECPASPGRVAVIVVEPSGERVVYERRDPGLVIPRDAITPAMVVDARVLLVDATQPAAAVRAAQLARESGTISLSDVDRPSSEADALLAEVDVAIVPESFALVRASTVDLRFALTSLATHCHHASIVVATRGAEGTLTWTAEGFIESPAVHVPVVDTTGAGDAFRAGLAAALLHFGDGARLADVLQFANATGALNCRAVGAQAGLPSIDEVLAHVTPGAPRLSK